MIELRPFGLHDIVKVGCKVGEFYDMPIPHDTWTLKTHRFYDRRHGKWLLGALPKNYGIHVGP